MNRFRTSKFKNTTPKIPKKDGWISDIRAGSFTSAGNHIKSSCRLVAFNTEQAGGGILGLTSLEAGPDGKWTVSHVPCHTDQVTDFDFSPFDDGVLATCSADETVKVWRLQEAGEEQPSEAEVTLSPGEGRVETVLFHPTSSHLLAVGLSLRAQLWDSSRSTQLAALEQHPDQLHGLSWKQDGSLLATTCKDKKLRVFDPRAQLTPVQSAVGHQNHKDSRILWIKDSDHILTTAFNQMRERECRLWDCRKLGSSLASVSLGTASGQCCCTVKSDLAIFSPYLHAGHYPE
ncbi:hypothetical protein GJAV_G00221960 [Gymnothorax javanicus]|nr:hypothetical protein GJAV_G00221960 [Gymnothorax javanicus]